jgi:anti-anti-sigma factor
MIRRLNEMRRFVNAKLGSPTAAQNSYRGGSTSAPSGAMIAPVEQRHQSPVEEHHQSIVDIQLAEIGQTANRLILCGRLDSTGAGLLDQTLPAAVIDIDRDIVADLSAVCFVGSRGIRLLISLARGLQKKGLRFVMYGLQPAVHDVFESVSLSELIPVTTTEAEALSLLAD